MSCLNLVLNPPRSRGAGGPGPGAPMLFPTGLGKPLQFTDLDALARHIHRQRGRRGLQLKAIATSYGGSDTFAAFEVRWLYDDSDEYAFTVAIQGRPRETLEAALAAANPDVPEPA